MAAAGPLVEELFVGVPAGGIDGSGTRGRVNRAGDSWAMWERTVRGERALQEGPSYFFGSSHSFSL